MFYIFTKSIRFIYFIIFQRFPKNDCVKYDYEVILNLLQKYNIF